MGISKIEEIIAEIEDLIASCNYAKRKIGGGNTNMILVPKDQIDELIKELKIRMPDEIRRYQKIIANRDVIIKEAQDKGAAIIEKSRQQAAMYITEHEITQQAYERANDILKDATMQANNMLMQANQDSDEIRQGALGYTEDMLTEIERILNEAYKSSISTYDAWINSLKVNLDIVRENKKELYEDETPQTTPINDTISKSIIDENDENSGFDFDENSFSDDMDK